MAIPDPISGKTELRKKMRQLLRGSVPSSAHACDALGEWLAVHPQLRVIGVFSALPGEIDLSRLILSRRDLRWVYPKVGGDGITLSFHSGENLAAGAFGILEPPDNSPEISVAEIDVFICPGLAFDERGGRLGRGRAFYDRMLTKARPGTLKIGICHSFQMVPETFSEPHDILMDAVIF